MAKRVVVITGVTRGLGLAMVGEFIRLGHVVIGCGRNGQVIRQLSAKHTSPHKFITLDVTSNDAVKNWAAATVPDHGAPDLLINNAALINKNAPLWQVPAEEFSSVIDVNIKGVANVIRHFLPAMIARKRGVVANFSSGWGRSTDPQVAPYCATKWAIEGLTQALAKELPATMAAVPVNPGIINTPMLQSCFGNSASHYPTAEQWAKKAVPFLLALSAKENGQQVTVA